MLSDNALPNTPSASNARVAEPGSAVDRDHLMAEWSIAFDGRQYRYNTYRYDRLSDAVKYAELERSRHIRVAESGSSQPSGDFQAPNDSQRSVMASLGITFVNDVYCFGAFRYDRLNDAINYARLQESRAKQA